MHYSGHLGVGFLVASPLYIFMSIIGVEPSTSITITFIAASISWVPDLDMKLGIKHRGPTHAIPVGLAVALVGALFFISDFIMFLTAFFSIFIALLAHILGDMMNIVKMPVFYPFSKKKYGGWKFFKSANQQANHYLFTSGIVVYVLALAFF